MKLLYITNGINGSGGLERVLSIKASFLADEYGYDVHIAGLNESTTHLFYEFSSKIKLHAFPVFGNPFSYLKRYVSGIKKLIQTIQPDVIIVCDDGLKGFFIPMIIGRGKPIIYERHVSKSIEIRKNASTLQKLFYRFKLKIMDYLSGQFSAFVLLTQSNVTEWKGKNVHVIPNPLSFYPEEQSTLINKKVLAVGKQSHQKGYDRLLRSWKMVHEKHADWSLEIYGKKDSSFGFERQAEALGISKNVHFFEPEKDIEKKYLQSSIYVLPSRFEGFGMVLIEAMACGLPCVAFDCPHGPSDIIQHNVDGFLIKNDDEVAFAEQVVFLIENQNTREKMGKQARENVKRFLPESIVQQWDNLFKELLQR
jgi:glycosyltransferase involved in cell wall biosynthesis